MRKPFFETSRSGSFRPSFPFSKRKALLWFCALSSAFFALSYLSVEIAAYWRVHSDSSSVPKNSVGLVLWTSPKLADGRSNAYFSYRMEAAAQLYRDKRVDCLLVSWDNATVSYNEIKSMQLALMEKGVPPERIFWDYAGFRTLDSVVRAKEVFWLSRFTVVSQESHAKRAIFLARLSGADVVAHEATTPPLTSWLRPVLREIPARALAFYDAVLAGVRPKFLGDPVKMETDSTVRPVPQKICYPR